MPGIFGFIGERSDSINWVDKGIAALCHRPWFQVSRHDEGSTNIVLGRVSNGILGSSQPIQDASGKITTFLDGELYNRHELFDELEVAASQQVSDGELILALYQIYPETFVERLEGSFTLSILDAEQDRLLIANDRYGLRPLFYMWKEKRLIFGPECKFILDSPFYSKELDFDTLSEYFRIQVILGDKTFFKGINVFPYASILRIDLSSKELNLKRYWDFDYIEDGLPNITFDEAVEEGAYLFKRAVQRLMNDKRRYGLYLSGGLDSRQILSAIPKDRYPIHTFTYGIRGCKDHIFAARVAKRANTIHHPVYFDSGKWVQDFFLEALETTENFFCAYHTHPLPVAPVAREYIDIHLSGFFGDVILGGSFEVPRVLANENDSFTLLREVHKFYTGHFGLAIVSDIEQRCLFSQKAWDIIRDGIWDTFTDEISCFSRYKWSNLLSFLNVANRGRKLILYNVLVAPRVYVEDRVPFYDYKFFEFNFSLPVSFRLNRRLQAEILKRLSPSLSRIETNSLLVPPGLSLIERTGRRLKSKAKRETLGRFTSRKELYPDSYCSYSEWTRNELRNWVESVLLDTSTLNRGLYNPGFVRSCIRKHMAGTEDCAWKIVLMLSYELMLRRYFPDFSL